MAGVAEHEGSSLLYGMLSQPLPKNLTEKDFLQYTQGFDSLFHNLNATAITDFYLAHVNKSDPEQVKWQLFDMFGDLMITCPTHQFAVNYAKQSDKSSVYFYETTYQRHHSTLYNVTHGAELDFVFGLPLIYPDKNDTEIDRQFSRDVMQMWTDFAKYGYELGFQ